VYCGFSELRVFKYGSIQNDTFTPDKELNILIYGTPFCVSTCRNYKLLTMVQFLAHPVYSCRTDVNGAYSTSK